jgi:16S rRNA (cytosine967-C5)-methyltransferase
VNGEKPREIAIRVLRRRADGAQYVEKLLENELADHPLSGPDRGLCQELAYGMVRRQATLDWLVARKTGNRQQNATLRLLLHLGLYQLFWMQRIPNHAAVHETVELAKQLGFGQQAGFLNAVLRGYTRERDATIIALENLKQADPASGYSHPAWLIERWQARWGKADTEKLLDWNNTPPPVYARANSLKGEVGSLWAAWREEGVDFAEQRFDWAAANLVFELKSHPPLARLPSFERGLYYVQDPSTLLAVEELKPQSGESILDLCAAPGGKTTAIAQRMENRGLIAARDNQPGRLELVRENCTRLGVTCVQFEGLDENLKFDGVLVDAPCSNTGVMRRRVDLRWRLNLAEINELARTQLHLLEQAALALKPGGRLVYSTCSLEMEENESVVQNFLGRHADFTLERQRQLLPMKDGVDGAYVARLIKTG